MAVTASNSLPTALKSGLIVGVFDAIAASTYSFALTGGTPDGVFRYVASGALGQAAFAGGLPVAALGLLFHFIIATSWTCLFFFLYPKIGLVSSTNKYIVGIGYGIFIWLMMTFVVVPLSNVPTTFHFTWRSLIMIGIHMFVIGVPISLFASSFYLRQHRHGHLKN